MTLIRCVVCSSQFQRNSPSHKYCGETCKLKSEYRRQMTTREGNQCIYTHFGGKIDKRVAEIGTGLGAYTMAQVRRANEAAGPLEGCEKCKRRTGHDDWCPNGEG